MKFRKNRPDANRFWPVVSDIYKQLGGIEKGKVKTLALSRVLGGTVLDESHSYVTSSGRTVQIRKGQSWVSNRSIVEDIFAAVGEAVSYRQVSYALQKLESDGLLRSELMLPETRGRYGKIYTLSERLLSMGDRVDVLTEYRLFYYGDTRDFKRAEVVTGDYKSRKGKVINIEPFERQLAERGTDRPAYTNVGRFRYGEEGNYKAPVFVPYIIIDLDRPILLDAWEDAHTVIGDLESAGIDLERVFVAFSGRRGFHIAVSTDQFGSPIFYDSISAKEISAAFVRSVTNVVADPSTFSPLSLVRLVGSIHNETGLYKRAYTVEEFRRMDYAELIADVRTFRPFTFPERTLLVESEALERFNDAVKAAKESIDELRQLKRNSKVRIGTVIGRILEGISEGETFSERHSGRNKAAFILACFVLESSEGAQAVADALGLPQAPEPVEILEYWNRRNAPPLSGRELQSVIRSAQRRVCNN